MTAREVAAMTQWQDISTAPKDVEVQAWCRVYGWRPQCRLVQRRTGENQWQEWGLDSFDGMGWIRMDPFPTHWAPQPSGPEGKE